MTLEQCWHRVPGGTARAAVDLVAALVALGEAPRGEGSRPLRLVGVSARHRRPAPEPYTPVVDVRALPLPRPLLYESWHRLRRPAVERATGPVDVVHATGLAVPPSSSPLVWTLHDLAFLREPRHFTPRGLRFFHAAVGLARSEAAVVLCSSEATRADAEAAGFDAERLRVVPLGHHPVPVSPDQVESVRRRRGLDRPYVLHVGTAEPRKNLAGLLDALRSLGRTDLDLVLVGPAGWGPDLGERIAGLGSRVHALGFVPEAEKAALYAGAAVFCYPSLWEGFGLPVLEALAQGTPTITSRGTATEEVAGDAAVLVEPTDVAALADAIASVVDDAAVADRLRAAGPERARRFTWDRTAAATARAYADAARGST